MRVNAARNILGGQFLTRKIITRNWKFILYIFLLVLIYISIHFGIRNTMQKSAVNEEIIKDLRSEYMEKYSSVLYQSKRAEIEELLNAKNSELIPPAVPPARIRLNSNY